MRRFSVRHLLWLVVPVALIVLTGMGQGTPSLTERVEQLEAEFRALDVQVEALENATAAIVDSNGIQVGTLLRANTHEAFVALEIQGHVVVVRLTKDRFEFTGAANAGFESEDCTGQAYTWAAGALDESFAETPSFVGFPGNTLYVSDGTPRTTRQIRSYLHHIEGCLLKSFEPEVQAVTALADLKQLYVPPYTLVVGP